MTLRKITIDNSVRFIPKSEQTKEKEIKPKIINAGSLPHKQNKIISKNNKKFLINISAQVFKYLKWIMNCYF